MLGSGEALSFSQLHEVVHKLGDARMSPYIPSHLWYWNLNNQTIEEHQDCDVGCILEQSTIPADGVHGESDPYRYQVEFDHLHFHGRASLAMSSE